MPKIKQLFCRHRYADKNLDIVEINHYTDTVRLRNYCVKCGKPYEVSFSFRCMFGEVEAKQEVRHGRWITKDLDNFRKIECQCSECGYIGISNYDSYDDPYDFNFCPNCGAMMDVGDTK